VQPLLVLLNEGAAGVDAETSAAVLAALRRTGAPFEQAACGRSQELVATLGQYPRHRPVVVGGDGTLHLVVAALHARGELGERVVGLVPLGTGNDLARCLGIPQTPEEAVAVVGAGHERALDLVVDDDGGVVVNAVHLGVGAQANRDATPLKPLLGPTAYRVGAVLAGLRSIGWPLQVVVDGQVLADGRRRLLQVGIGNGPTIGGGTPLAPDAVPDDGLADVLVSAATGPIARARYGRLLRQGRHPELPDVLVTRGRQIEVSGPPIPVNSDGELGRALTRRRWTVHPHAWRITVPA